jgi:hypothetical protein
MNGLTIALGVVIAITAMLAIPNAPAHFARASSCSSSANTGHSTKQTGGTGSGSCATSSAASGTPLRFGLNENPTSGTPRGNTNSCSSNSIGATTTSFQDKSASGSSVSCSSHPP